uniref:Flavin-containing monooxygenase n=1 Tax=Panagrolaimus davidi TaxID=227884 RepID=A0A914NZ12_9BILA
MISRKPDRVAIIGAGVSGIAAARQAIAYGFDPIVFEKSPNLGGIWNYSDDPDVRSVSFSTTSLTSKELMAFSEFPPPEKFGIFMHHTEILEYLNLYVDNFKLRHLIKFSTEVIAVNRADDWKDSGHWIVTTKDGSGNQETEIFGAVLLCTGMHSKPARPFEYRMETAFQGKISHSSNFKSSDGYKDKTVVLVGFGNSAVQCACDLVPIAKKVYISTRRGSWLYPATTTTNEPWDISHNSRIHYFGRKFIPKYIRNWLWEISINERFDHVSAGIEPDHRFLAANYTFAKNGFLDYLNAKRIEIVQNLLSFTETGVELVDKRVIEHVDEVGFCG